MPKAFESNSPIYIFILGIVGCENVQANITKKSKALSGID